MEIRLMDGAGQPALAVKGEEDAQLLLDRPWREDDSVVIQARPGTLVEVCLDGLRGEVFLPRGEMTWRLPWGDERLAYRPGLFEGNRHVISARALSPEERARRRDLALNPLDLRGETDFYPHVSANVETRGEAVFAARNVVDGLRLNTFHGEWPYESWGIGAREDAWCQLDFGREVSVDSMALTLRADFPHDAWWLSGHVVDSNGQDTAFSLQKTGERQWISLGGRRVRWLRLERLVKSDDPSAFPSLRSWEVMGRELAD